MQPFYVAESVMFCLLNVSLLESNDSYDTVNTLYTTNITEKQNLSLM